jgi:hypothetical protein
MSPSTLAIDLTAAPSATLTASIISLCFSVSPAADQATGTKNRRRIRPRGNDLEWRFKTSLGFAREAQGAWRAVDTDPTITLSSFRNITVRLSPPGQVTPSLVYGQAGRRAEVWTVGPRSGLRASGDDYP